MVHPITDGSLRTQVINHSLLLSPVKRMKWTGAGGICWSEKVYMNKFSEIQLVWPLSKCMIPRDIFYFNMK